MLQRYNELVYAFEVALCWLKVYVAHDDTHGDTSLGRVRYF